MTLRETKQLSDSSLPPRGYIDLSKEKLRSPREIIRKKDLDRGSAALNVRVPYFQISPPPPHHSGLNDSPTWFMEFRRVGRKKKTKHNALTINLLCGRGEDADFIILFLLLMFFSFEIEAEKRNVIDEPRAI